MTTKTSVPSTGARPTVFLSYSHQDEVWKDRVVVALRALELQDDLEVWDDRRIAAGDGWQSEIEKAMNRAAVAVLLISTDFLASRFIRGTEVPHLLKRRQEEGLRVIPLFVRPSPWPAVGWLAAIQGRPKDAKALSGWTDHEADQILSDLALEIQGHLAGIPSDTAGPTGRAPEGGAGVKPGVSTPGGRSPDSPSPERATATSPPSLRDSGEGGGDPRLGLKPQALRRRPLWGLSPASPSAACPSPALS